MIPRLRRTINTVAAVTKILGRKSSHLSYAWTRENVSPDTKRFLGSLPFRIDIRPLGGHVAGPTITLVHGNQGLNTVYVTEDRSDASTKMGAGVGARAGDVVAFGHTHKPWHRAVEGVHFVNTGSVGRPKDGDCASGYATIAVSGDGEVAVRVHRVESASIAQQRRSRRARCRMSSRRICEQVARRCCWAKSRSRNSDKMSLARRCLAEALGTFVLVLIGSGAIMVAARTHAFGHVGVSLAFGLAVTLIVASGGHLGGAHVNPAVTIGFWSVGRFRGRDVAPYVIAQCAGAVLAAVACGWALGDVAFYGATLPSLSTTRAFAVEMVFSGILAFVIMGVATDDRSPLAVAPFAIGATVFAGALVTGPIREAVSIRRVRSDPRCSLETGPLTGCIGLRLCSEWCWECASTINSDRGQPPLERHAYRAGRRAA